MKMIRGGKGWLNRAARIRPGESNLAAGIEAMKIVDQLLDDLWNSGGVCVNKVNYLTFLIKVLRILLTFNKSHYKIIM